MAVHKRSPPYLFHLLTLDISYLLQIRRKLKQSEVKTYQFPGAVSETCHNFIFNCSDRGGIRFLFIVLESEADKLNEDKIKYIANEGIRVSSIVKITIEKYQKLDEAKKNKYQFIKDLIDDATGVKPFAGTPVKSSINAAGTEEALRTTGIEDFEKAAGKNVRDVSYYKGRKGYDAKFLNKTIALPKLTKKALEFGNPAKTDSGDTILHYTHFSICFNEDRKIAFYTAVNIDGKKWRNIKRGDDKWFFDPRIPLEIQADDALYGNEPKDLGKKGWFDRGHLVRRQDPDWGTMEIAALADEDSFHWTNCSPQYWGFNQGQELWQGLENYILYNTDQEDIRATVFSGPIFSKDDEVHRDVPIPMYFWKIVVVNDSEGNLYSAGYIVSQKEYATNIPFEVIPVEDFNHFQVKVSRIEELTGLRFTDTVQESDVMLNSNKDMEGMRSLADVKLKRRK